MKNISRYKSASTWNSEKENHRGMGAGRDAADERPGEAETLKCKLTQRKDETRQLRSCSEENVILKCVAQARGTFLEKQRSISWKCLL